jgi:hypothetical protein
MERPLIVSEARPQKKRWRVQRQGG